MFPATNWPIHSTMSACAFDTFWPKICKLQRFNLCVSSAYEYDMIFRRDAECMCVYSSVRDTRVRVHFTSPPITGRFLPLEHHPFLQTGAFWSHRKAAHRWRIFLGIYGKHSPPVCTLVCKYVQDALNVKCIRLSKHTVVSLSTQLCSISCSHRESLNVL